MKDPYLQIGFPRAQDFSINCKSLCSKCYHFTFRKTVVFLGFQFSVQISVKLGETNLTFVKDTKHQIQRKPNSQKQRFPPLNFAPKQHGCLSVWAVVKRKSIFRNLWQQSLVNRRKQVLSNLKVYTLAGCEVAGPGFLLCHSYITFLPGQGSGDRGFDRRGRAPFSHGVTDEFFRWWIETRVDGSTLDEEGWSDISPSPWPLPGRPGCPGCPLGTSWDRLARTWGGWPGQWEQGRSWSPIKTDHHIYAPTPHTHSRSWLTFIGGFCALKFWWEKWLCSPPPFWQATPRISWVSTHQQKLSPQYTETDVSQRCKETVDTNIIFTGCKECGHLHQNG